MKEPEVAKGEDVCEICKTVLNDLTIPKESLDLSPMFETHCNRCYRHELIFDTEWPNRKPEGKVFYFSNRNFFFFFRSHSFRTSSDPF